MHNLSDDRWREGRKSVVANKSGTHGQNGVRQKQSSFASHPFSSGRKNGSAANTKIPFETMRLQKRCRNDATVKPQLQSVQTLWTMSRALGCASPFPDSTATLHKFTQPWAQLKDQPCIRWANPELCRLHSWEQAGHFMETTARTKSVTRMGKGRKETTSTDDE